jgi:hypothetical protein
MAVLYVATSKTLQSWAADVGLGKAVYKVGYAAAGDPETALAGDAGQSDWKILATAETDEAEDALLDRLAHKNKLVDPTYYPRLKGATGIVKVNTTAVENAMLVAIALENRDPPKTFKVKPVDIARFLIRSALGS